MTHRIGIIGLGTVGARFVEQFNHHADFELVAAWDPDPVACAAHRADVDISDDAAGVIAAADAVYIAVPPLFHAGYVEQCVRAGVAIFCEKPLGINVDESRRLVALVESSGLPAGVNFVFSSAPAAVDLQRRVGDGEIGQIVRGDLRLHFAEWPRAWHAKAQWLRLRDQGGWIREVASHFLFLATRVLGPLAIDSSAVTYPDGADAELCEVDVQARLSSATAPLVLAGTSEGVGPDINDLTIRGTTGSLRVWDWYRLQHSDGGEWTDKIGTDRAEQAAAAYGGQLDELAHLLAGEPSTIASFAEALAVQELVEQLLGNVST